MKELKKRIKISPNGIKVEADSEEYELYYGLFTLADDPVVEPRALTRFRYWKPPEAYEQTIEKSSFVYVAEKRDGVILDSYRFYFNKNGRKPILTWSINKMCFLRRFEKGAHEIIIRWKSGKGEKIRSEYLYLHSVIEKDDGKSLSDQYHFLVDYIEPLELNRGDYVDRYIFFLEEESNSSDYGIGFDELIHAKYDIRLEQ